jgi:hypothetical protein
MRRVIALAVVGIMMMGAEGPSSCEGQRSRGPAPKSTTPPQSSTSYTYELSTSWNPATEIVEMDFRVGDRRPVFQPQKSGGSWSETIRGDKKVAARVRITWTNQSWSQAQKLGPKSTCKIVINGKIYGPNAKKEGKTKELICEVKVSDIP